MKPSTVKKDTPLSLSIYNASQLETKLSDYKPKSKEENALITEIGVWSALVGYKCNAQELKVIVGALKKAFPTYNLVDIKTARDMSTEGQFKTRYVGNFSSIYVNSIMAEYRNFRGEAIVSHRQKKAKQNQDKPLPKPSEKKRIETYKQILWNAYSHQKDLSKESDYVDLGNVLYDFIKKNRLVKVTNEIINKATEHAKKTYLQTVKDKNYGAVIKGEYIEKRKKANEKIVSYQKQYIIIHFIEQFKDKKEFAKFVDNISIDMIKNADVD